MEDFGSFFKAKRKELRMSQAELANILGVTTRSIIGWESGKIEPRRDKIKEIQKKIDEISGETGERPGKPGDPVNRERAMLKVLWQRWAKFEAAQSGQPVEKVLDSMDADTMIAWRDLERL